MINIVLIDDQEESLEHLHTLIKNFLHEVNVAGVAVNLCDGLRLITEARPEIVFVNSRLYHENEFNSWKISTGLDFTIILMTSDDEYVAHPAKFAILDYLIKPVDVNELKEVINKYLLKIISQQVDLVGMLLENLNFQKNNKRLAISSTSEINVIDLKQIIYLESSGSYTYFHVASGKKYLASKNLKEYEKLLVQYGFLRVHKSFLINLSEITQYVKSGAYVVLSNETEVSISEKKRKELLHVLSRNVLSLNK